MDSFGKLCEWCSPKILVFLKHKYFWEARRDYNLRSKLVKGCFTQNEVDSKKEFTHQCFDNFLEWLALLWSEVVY